MTSELETTARKSLQALPTRAAWLEARRSGIGGSDVAAILGKNPWRGPLQVWLDKRGELAPEPMTPAMRAGVALEPVVAEMYREREGCEFADLPPFSLFRGGEPWELASPDRMVADRPLGLEIKTASRRDGWGDEGTDQVPEHYLLQCSWYAAVTRVERWDLAVLVGGVEYRQYRLEIDGELQGLLREAVAAWWRRHIVDGVQPDVDGSAEAARWLARKFPRNVAPLATATSAQAELLGEYAALRGELAALEADREGLEARIKEQIGAAEGLVWDGGRVTWRRTKDGTALDHSGYIRSLEATLLGAGHSEGQIALMRREHTTVKEGSRRLLLTPAKEDK